MASTCCKPWASPASHRPRRTSNATPAASGPPPPRLTGELTLFRLRVKAGHEAEYVERHKDVWPVVLADLERAGCGGMRIWMDGTDLYLLMCTRSYAAAAAALDASPKSVEWERYMEPLLEAGDGAAYNPTAAYPDGLPCVWSWDAPHRARELGWLQRAALLMSGAALGAAAAAIVLQRR